ncbi:MAG: hypothetical protein HQL38_20520 [Alphaproteobacteria bacterium]|nr:hypothetical protein [Alphaproteobacteria bacterium]
MTDDEFQIIPPRQRDVEESPSSMARAIARDALAGAMATMRAAHRAAIDNLDRALDDSVPPTPANGTSSSDAAGESRSLAESIRLDFLTRMEARVWALGDALQRSSLVDIGTANAAVDAIRRGTARKRDTD